MTEHVIHMGTIYQVSFGDYKDAAEDLSKEKGLPVRFEWGGYYHTVEFIK